MKSAHSMRISRCGIRRQRGTTMLEVLVTIIVIALGLLGVAGLQAVSLKNNNTAYHRSQATMFAYDIIDRMRVNRASAIANDYNIAIGVTPSGATMAKTDLIAWKTNIASGLPAGDGSVSVVKTTVSAVDYYTVTIVVQWEDKDSKGNANSFTTQTRL